MLLDLDHLYPGPLLSRDNNQKACCSYQSGYRATGFSNDVYLG